MKYIGYAIKEASKSPNRCFQHGCVILYKQKIIASSYNSSIECHAEHGAINKLCEIRG